MNEEERKAFNKLVDVVEKLNNSVQILSDLYIELKHKYDLLNKQIKD